MPSGITSHAMQLDDGSVRIITHRPAREAVEAVGNKKTIPGRRESISLRDLDTLPVDAVPNKISGFKELEESKAGYEDFYSKLIENCKPI